MVNLSQQNSYLSSGFYFTKNLKPQPAAILMSHLATGTFINIKYVTIHNCIETAFYNRLLKEE
jgi:hypothetical protein